MLLPELELPLDPEALELEASVVEPLELAELDGWPWPLLAPDADWTGPPSEAGGADSRAMPPQPDATRAEETKRKREPNTV